MPEHDIYDDHELFNPETHHESSDVPVRPLWWAIGIFVVFAIVTHLVLALMYKGLARAERDRMEEPQTTVQRPADADVPQNQPLLQPFPRAGADGRPVRPQDTTPVADMKAMRRAEQATLDNYGWVDKQRGTVHIPIEEAKSLLAARLAVQGQTGAAPASTTTATPDRSGAAPAGTVVPPATDVPPALTTTPTGGSQQ